MKRLLFYLPDREIGASAPPASQLTCFELLNYLKEYYEIVVYSKGCDVEGVVWIKEKDQMPHNLHDAIKKASPDITWSYMNWGSHEHRSIPKGAYIETVSNMPFMPHPELQHIMAEAKYVLKSVPKATYVRPFVPHSETVRNFYADDERSVLYMHHPRKGLKETIEICKLSKVDNLFITLDESEVLPYTGELPDWAHCIGRITGHDKKRFLARCCAIAYFTRLQEAIGMSACEAMLSGLAVLGVSNNTSIQQYIDDGEIPSMLCNSMDELKERVQKPWENRHEIQERARIFFNHHRAISDRIDFIENVIRRS